MLNRISTLNDVCKMLPRDFVPNHLQKEEFVKIARLCGGYYMNDGSINIPHVALGSYCSNGYLKMEPMLQYSNVTQVLAQEMIRNMPSTVRLDNINWVVGSEEARELALDIASILGALYIPLDVLQEYSPSESDTVLHIEGMIDSGRKALAVREALKDARARGVNVIPYIPAVASRPTCDPSVSMQILDAKIFFVPRYCFYEFVSTPKEKCELCRGGSKRMKPEELFAVV